MADLFEAATAVERLRVLGVVNPERYIRESEMHDSQITAAIEYYETHRMREGWQPGALVAVLQRCDLHGDPKQFFPDLRRLRAAAEHEAADNAIAEKRQQYLADRAAAKANAIDCVAAFKECLAIRAECPDDIEYRRRAGEYLRTL